MVGPTNPKSGIFRSFFSAEPSDREDVSDKAVNRLLSIYLPLARILVAEGLAGTVLATDDVLRCLAEQTGDPAFMRAANALHQQAPGRPSIDDAKLIEEAVWLFKQGKAKSINQALRKVARTVADQEGVRSVAERLRRKMRADAKKSSTKLF